MVKKKSFWVERLLGECLAHDEKSRAFEGEVIKKSFRVERLLCECSHFVYLTRSLLPWMMLMPGWRESRRCPAML